MKFVTSTSQHQAAPSDEHAPFSPGEVEKSPSQPLEPEPPIIDSVAKPRIVEMRPIELQPSGGNDYVRVNLTPQATAFIYKMLQQPNELPDKPYAAPHTRAAKEIIALTDWLMGPEGKGNPKLIMVEVVVMQGMPGKKWETKGSSVEMRRKYVERLKDMCAFHKEAGMLVHNCRGYQELLAGLGGQMYSLDKDVER